jgi:hypothetical protein
MVRDQEVGGSLRGLRAGKTTRPDQSFRRLTSCLWSFILNASNDFVSGQIVKVQSANYLQAISK